MWFRKDDDFGIQRRVHKICHLGALDGNGSHRGWSGDDTHLGNACPYELLGFSPWPLGSKGDARGIIVPTSAGHAYLIHGISEYVFWDGCHFKEAGGVTQAIEDDREFGGCQPSPGAGIAQSKEPSYYHRGRIHGIKLSYHRGRIQGITLSKAAKLVLAVEAARAAAASGGPLSPPAESPKTIREAWGDAAASLSQNGIDAIM